VKEICETMRPEYDFLANLTDQFIAMKLDPVMNNTVVFLSPDSSPSPPYYFTPPLESEGFDSFHLNIIDINTVSALFEQA